VPFLSSPEGVPTAAKPTLLRHTTEGKLLGQQRCAVSGNPAGDD
jgi:hypothetical protein